MYSDGFNKRFPSGLPASLLTAAKKFEDLASSSNVINVTLLSNFGKDVELSLFHSKDIYKGVVVETSGEYILSEKDSFWFHPQLFKKRSLFHAETSKSDVKYNDVKEGDGLKRISKFNSCVGRFSTHSFDEIGGTLKENYLIIDTCNDNTANAQVKHWMVSGIKIKNIYNEMHTVKIDGKTLDGHSLAQTESLVPPDSKLLMSQTYNVILRSATSFLFYNHALKPENGEALVQISPLMGYVKFTGLTSPHFASDLMTADEYLNIKEFTEEQMNRAYVAASWSGKQIVNTFALRKPFDNYLKIIGDSSIKYRMESASFSSSPIVEKLSPAAVLLLTPEATNIPEEKAEKLHKHILQNVIKMPASQEILQKLLRDHWKTLLSSKYVSGDNLCLPRELVNIL